MSKRRAVGAPSAQAINALSQKQWGEWNRKIATVVERNPARAAHLAKEQVIRLHAGVPLAAEESITKKLLDDADLSAAEQTRRARKLRPKRAPTHRSEVIAAMRAFRSDGATLKEFLQAASNRSVADMRITLEEMKYAIDCENVEAPATRVTMRTLDVWWAAAGKAA